MGFRTGSYAKVWEVKTDSDTRTTLRISVSRKNKQTDQYEQDFSGFVQFVGTANAAQAARLTSGATIKIGDCDVTTRYVAETKVTYTNFTVFSFEEVNQYGSSQPTVTPPDEMEFVDSGESDDLPY